MKWYGVIIAVGFLLAFSYAMVSCKKFNIDQDKLIDVIIVGMIGGMIGARAYYVIFDTSDQYLRNPISALYIWEGGLAIYGGIIGGMLCGSLMAKFRKISIPAVLDIASLGFFFGQAIGRWGNFVNQEAFGVETKLPWGMVSENTYAVTNNPVHPCFLYESLWCILGFVLLHIFSRKLRRYDGQVFLLYLIWYGVGRFFIEGLRTDSLITPVLPLRVSQVVAAATVLTGIILLIVFRSRTSLIGCGSAKVMELNAIVDEVPAECIESGANEEIGNDAEKAEDSADLAPEESAQAEEAPAGEPAAAETAEEVPAEEEKEAPEATETNTK